MSLDHPHTRPAPMDMQRVLTVHAFVALIDRQLAESSETLPGGAARAIVSAFERAGLATVIGNGDLTRITMLGVSASTTGSAYALLTHWQSAALRRTEGAA